VTGRPNETFLVTLSSSGQVTVPAPIRKLARERGTRKFRVTLVDAGAGIFQFEPVLGLAEALSKYVRLYDPPLRETLRALDAEEAAAWEDSESGNSP